MYPFLQTFEKLYRQLLIDIFYFLYIFIKNCIHICRGSKSDGRHLFIFFIKIVQRTKNLAVNFLDFAGQFCRWKWIFIFSSRNIFPFHHSFKYLKKYLIGCLVGFLKTSISLLWKGCSKIPFTKRFSLKMCNVVLSLKEIEGN